jgi:hypothetical protein
MNLDHFDYLRTAASTSGRGFASIASRSTAINRLQPSFMTARPQEAHSVTAKGAGVRSLVLIAAVGGALLAAPLLAEDTGPGLERFRAAYEAGNGLSYVVIPDEKGEQVYRYGDASRQAAKKDKRGFMLFTCASPHVFETDRISHRAALAKAKVVHAGEPRFAELDAQYLQGCKNPFVKSAVPQAK